MGADRTPPHWIRIANWAAITSGHGQGSLQADRTYTGNADGGEYHVWPAVPAAAWTALADSSPAFFAAPLPSATTLVNDWTVERGGDLVSTFPDGRVVIDHGEGERRVLAGSPTATNYTVTSNAKLNHGSGYGVYVRATVDADTKLTGYCVQLDHGYGALLVRLVQNDVELGAPVAQIACRWLRLERDPSDQRYGQGRHDGRHDGRLRNDRDPRPRRRRRGPGNASGVSTPIVAPAAGGYGFRAWSQAQVTLQQMTVTGAG